MFFNENVNIIDESLSNVISNKKIANKNNKYFKNTLKDINKKIKELKIQGYEMENFPLNNTKSAKIPNSLMLNGGKSLADLQKGNSKTLSTTIYVNGAANSEQIQYWYNYKGMILYGNVSSKFLETTKEFKDRLNNEIKSLHYKKIIIAFYNKKINKYKIFSFS